MLKTTGYLISAVSVLLLGAAAWPGTASDPLLRWSLIGGMSLAIAGMFCRWLSYQKQEQPR